MPIGGDGRCPGAGGGYLGFGPTGGPGREAYGPAGEFAGEGYGGVEGQGGGGKRREPASPARHGTRLQSSAPVGEDGRSGSGSAMASGGFAYPPRRPHRSAA